MSKENVIFVENLVKKYDLYKNPKDRFLETIGIGRGKLHTEFLALDGVSFSVEKGETAGIIGTNGAGKSTLLKIITGVLQPSGGTVEINGRISALLELGAGFRPDYSGMENIYLNGRMMGFSKAEMEKRVPVILDFAEIGEFIHQPVKTYSSGMFARLAFAVAINVEPDILIVDEALSVGDLFFQNKCFKKFDELREKGVTILFVSHDISSVRQMCSHVLWLEHGRVEQFGDADEVCDRYMDHKRKGMNELREEADEQLNQILSSKGTGKRLYPAMKLAKTDLKSDKFEFLSCFVTEKNGKIVQHMTVDEEYQVHVAIRFFEDMKNVIVGFVFENNKGLPLYDINNFINQQQGIRGVAGEVTEIIYSYKLPRLMKGRYVVSVALAEGTQESHTMHTWLHGVEEIEIVNPGFNSSYIEIPAEIKIEQYDPEQVEVVEEGAQ